MPARKKTSFSSTSQDAKRKRLQRAEESELERLSRLASQREHMATMRASEDEDQRETRLRSLRDRQAATRASESINERNARLDSQRERQAEARASETINERNARLDSQRERQAEARASETINERNARLDSQRERQTVARASESNEDIAARLGSQRLRQSAIRTVETDETREMRLAADRECHASARELESASQRAARLEAARERALRARMLLEAGRAGAQQRVAELRSGETPEERDVRLLDDRLRHHSQRLPDDDNVSIAYDEVMSELRSGETPEERDVRLLDDRLRHHSQRLPDDDNVSVAYDEVMEHELSIAYDSIHNELSIAYDSIHNNMPWDHKIMSGFAYNAHINYEEGTNIGQMTVVCAHCRALKWSGEPNGLCCAGGKVRLEPLQRPPEPLQSLLVGEHPLSKQFLKCIRNYNGAFQMTSFGATEIREGNFMPCFKVQGQVCHRIGSLLPINNASSKFLQIYFIADYQEQADARLAVTHNLDRTVVLELQHLLHEHNMYVVQFKSALRSLPSDQLEDYKVVIRADRIPANAHRGRYNEPTTNEVAVVLVNEDCGTRDIVLRGRDDRLQRISETHRAYDTLQYPLMFPRGEDGYHFELRLHNPTTGQLTAKKTSAMQFYAYRLMIREQEQNYLLFFKQTLNQFLVDMYAKIEAERLLYIRTHQSSLRAENYIHLQDALRQDGDPENLGRLVILPSTFTGGPRYMHQRTQDAFVYVRKYGRPDLFITVTTNPKWEEITGQLSPGQLPQDRHDIISRVFHLKQKALMDLLIKDKVFGAVRCHMFSVEWQKRGLPHAHILLWLETKIQPNQMDDVICAEFPNEEIDPALFAIVKAHMVHGPCGVMNPQSPCMREGRCSKRFPKPLTAATITGEDGYPTYRRRSVDDGGCTATMQMRGQSVTLDNRWVVPYSPVLSRALKTHINVEFCSSIQAIKYLCKYVNKGSDQATFAVQNERDEVSRYQSGRYVSTSEAVWRIFAYPINERFPPVIHLDVHLENRQRVYFNPSNLQDRVDNPRDTTLTAFFELCRRDAFARTLLYEEVPSYYTFDKQRGVFNRRLRGVPVDGQPGIRRENTLGRVYTVHPNSAECFYLRLLITSVRGPTSFEDLKTVDGVQYPTYQAACAARNLLEDDQHWNHTLEEACVSQSAAMLRKLFAIMLAFCNIHDANQLWTKYCNSLAEDIEHAIRLRHPECDIEGHRAEVLNECLLKLEDLVLANGGRSLESYGLPEPRAPAHNAAPENREYAAETGYDVAALAGVAAEDEHKLTHDQKLIYEEILESATRKQGKLFFLDAPGGTGKTFLINLLLNKVRSQGNIVLAVASSGIAATLLPGGRTAHSCFRIPINLDFTESPVCEISKNSNKAAVIRDCTLIVWDECTMAHKKAIEAVDRTLRDIREDRRVMGGVTFLFSGDFRQTLPVVPRGTRADEVNACFKRSSLWGNVQRRSLRQNMRALLGGGADAQLFSDILLSVGDGTMPELNGRIFLPPSLCITVPTTKDLILNVYPDIQHLADKEDFWLCERGILAPRNDEVSAINNTISGLFESTSRTYTSINTVMDQGDATNYPVEFLNSLNASGLPAHELQLKIGAPIMLMRNLSPPKLCNGTRLRIKNLQRNLIEATILTGCGRGEGVLIPRIPLIPSNFPFAFKRLQFPVSVSFAMTINKAQGQTLGTVGVQLRSPCFSHGQLYVACSRVSGCERLYVCAPDRATPNVVYKEALA